MTEEEAKTKWCPYMHSEVINEKGRVISASNKCIASDCMMWMWDMSPRDASEINARGNAGAVENGRCGLSK